jgi:hypothetical protein
VDKQVWEKTDFDKYQRDQAEKEKKMEKNLALIRLNGKREDSDANRLARDDLRMRLYNDLWRMLDEEILYLVDDDETYDSRERALSIATLLEKLKSIDWA